MVVPPNVYERLSEIQAELLRSGSSEPTSETQALMREGASALRQFQGIDATRLAETAARLASQTPAGDLAADRDWLTDQIGRALTTWNEWRREPWLQD